MKKIMLLAASFLIGGAVFAQGPVKYGIRAGVSLPTYRFSGGNMAYETKSTTNFAVTGYADIPVASNLYVQPGITFQGRGGKFASSNSGANEYTWNTMNLGIPLNLVGKLPIAAGTSLYLGAGPYVDFALSGKEKVKINNSTSENDLNIGSDAADDLKAFDAGFNFIAGVELGSGFQVGAGYGLGLTNLNPVDNGTKMNNRGFTFNVGFSF